MGPDTKGINAVPLLGEGPKDLLVDIVAGNYGQVLYKRLGELLRQLTEDAPDRLREVGQVAAVEPNAPGPVADLIQGQRHRQEVIDSGRQRVVGVYEGQEAFREALRVGEERREFSLVILRRVSGSDLKGRFFRIIFEYVCSFTRVMQSQTGTTRRRRDISCHTWAPESVHVHANIQRTQESWH